MHVDVSSLERQLGSAVRARRVAARLTQADVADRANMSVGAVSNLERGVGANVSTLLAVVAVLGAADWIDELVPKPEFNPFDVPVAAAADIPDRRRVRHSADRP